MKRVFAIVFLLLLVAGKSFSQFSVSLSGSTLITTGWSIGGYASVVDSTVQLTTPSTNENGYVYFDSAVNLTSCAQFTVDFDYQIIRAGGSALADGIAFFYIRNPPVGFITGGGLGLPNPVTGLVFTLDTYDNDGDGLNPESELYGYTTASTYSEANRTQLITTIRGGETFMGDGTWHHIKLTYNSGNINVYFDYSLVAGMSGFYLITIPAGYFGFSSSTGAAYSTQSVKSIHITATGVAPPPTVTSPVTYCQFATADTLLATGIGPFHWYTTDTGTVPLPGSPRPNTSVPGSTWYYVRQGTNPCISVPDSIQVIINPQPTAPLITGTTVYCQDSVFIPFRVSGTTGTILWYTSATGGVGSTTPPIVNTTIPGTYTYWATQTVLGCESPRSSITVIVHGVPSMPTISGTSVYCQFSPYIPPTATTTGTGSTILWYTTATGGVGSTVVPSVNTNVAGTYVLYATQMDSGCISPRAAFTITVNPKPVPPVISALPSNYCPGQPFVPFTVTTGTGILWYTSSSGGVGVSIAPGVNTVVPGTYTFWASQTVAGCESDRTMVRVTVADSLSAGFSYQLRFGCSQDTVYFTNLSGGATSYNWKFGDNSPQSLAINPTHYYISHGIDTVTLIAAMSPCFDSVKQVIDHSHSLKGQFQADSTIICQGKKVTFTDGSSGMGLNYLWSFGDGYFSNLANPVHKYPNTGIYKVFQVVTDFVPCSDTSYATISVDSISPIHIAVTDTVLCRGNYITLTGIYSSIGNTGITWSLGNGEIVKNVNPLSYAYLSTGTFTVTASASYRQCPDTSISRRITVIPTPVINLGNDTSICKGSQPFVISDNINRNTPGAIWEWNTGQTTSSIVITEPGDYIETVKIGGCTSSYQIRIVNDCYINVPNVFTPNSDGLNDYFFPRNLLTSGLTGFRMEIYNRWGQTVFISTSTDGRGWDGKFNDVEQPEGVYVYYMDATFKDGQHEHHQGNITLIR